MMSIIATLFLTVLILCAGPVVGWLAYGLGLVDHQLSYQESVSFAGFAIWFGLGVIVVGQLVIEWPASVLGLEFTNRGPQPKYNKSWQVIGHRHFTRRVAWTRHGFRAFAVVASVTIGYWVATTFTIEKLTPTALMLIASTMALAPVAWFYAVLGKCVPTLRRFMTRRTVYITCQPA